MTMAHSFEMIILVFLLGTTSIEALHENISAVHYSIVSPGIDDLLNPGKRLVYKHNERIYITKFSKPTNIYHGRALTAQLQATKIQS